MRDAAPWAAFRLDRALESQSEASASPDHGEIENHRQRAAREERRLEAPAVAKQCGDEQEHWQRRDHVPEGRSNVRRHAVGIMGVTPEPDHAEDGHQRQRSQQGARGGAAFGEFGDRDDDDCRDAGL